MSKSDRFRVCRCRFALDADKGPVVFEVNARPGLGIQVANQQD
jgi:D-alanine-D-alanine ligase-like ATP-grasp enzyme